MINRISIKNFRSIKEIEIEPEKLSALIGPNSSGKTNVLKAIDLVLGEGWTTKAKVARELFNDPNHPIEIEIGFNSPIVVPSDKGYKPTEVTSVELTMSLNPELSVTTTINGREKFWVQDAFKKICHFILIPSYRNLSTELKVSQWTMLGKMMRLIYGNYISHYDNDEGKLKDVFKQKISQAKEFLEDDFSADVTFKKFIDTFRTKCDQNSLGLAINFSPSLDIYNLNWFYKTLQIHVEEDNPQKVFDCEEVGSGMQNLLMISIFQTYAELMGGRVIFGIEEPEIYLYPQAQRALYKNFIELSKNTQIFYTTHNPNFVDPSRPDDITILRRKKGIGTYNLQKEAYFTTQNADKEKFRIYTQFNPERNELFFAKKVLFVEGDSDKILFSKLCEEKWQIDLNKQGISVIECNGKGGVNYFIGVCKLIGFEDYFAVWDEDPGDQSYSPEKDFLPETLSNKKGLEITPNLESFLGLPQSKSEKVKNAFEWAHKISESEIPSEFESVRLFITGKEDTPKNMDTDPDVEKLAEDLPF